MRTAYDPDVGIIEFAMRMTSRSCVLALLPALAWSAAATASPLTVPAPALHMETASIPIGERWYRDVYDDDDYDDPPEYYLPPPPPVVRVVPAPHVMVYETPVYRWLAPPRPSNCGKYRYWNGEYCADARYEPPYTGPRW